MSLNGGGAARTKRTAFMDVQELFGPNSVSEVSPTIQVDDEPYIIRAHGLNIGETIAVEMVDGPGEGKYATPYMMRGCQVVMTRKCNQIVIPVPGRYRFILNGAVGVPYVTAIAASMTHEYLLGAMQMSGCCGESPTTLPPSGPAGGVLKGNYPNPDLNTVVAADELSRDDSAMTLFAKGLCGKLNDCIAKVFKRCDGSDHQPGESIPTCIEMHAAIDAASAPKLTDCTGAPHAAGARVPTCAQMADAITDAALVLYDCNNTRLHDGAQVATCSQVDDKINAAIGKIPADKFLEDAHFDPNTATFTFTLSDGSAYSVSVYDMVPVATNPQTMSGNGTVAAPLGVRIKAGGSLAITTDGLAVAPDTTSAPSTTTGDELPTSIYGGRDVLLGKPDGWMSINGKRIPYWN